jgi:hypothetical protein
MSVDTSALDAVLTAGPIASTQTEPWGGAIDSLRREWLKRAPVLAEADLSRAQVELVVDLVFAILDVIARHPSSAPAHGTGHVRRTVAHGLAIALSEGLSEPDAARLLLAAAAHDLGRLKLIEDSPQLRHAGISALLLDELAPALAALPASIIEPVRYAVAAHTFISPEGDHFFRAATDLRAADSLDAMGTGAGLLRNILHCSSFPDLSARLPLDDAPDGWLAEWRTRSLNIPPYPHSRVPWARLERLSREATGRALLEALPRLSRSPRGFQPRLRSAVRAIEPDVPADQVDRVLAAIESLEPREIERWAQLVEVMALTWRAEAARLENLLDAAEYLGDRILAPVAAGLRAGGVARSF